MSLYTNFLRSVALPAGSRIAGYEDVMPYLRGLEESQWWPLERLRELQNQKLRRLIAHVYQHVPFYRDLMDQRGLAPADYETEILTARLACGGCNAGSVSPANAGSGRPPPAPPWLPIDHATRPRHPAPPGRCR